MPEYFHGFRFEQLADDSGGRLPILCSIFLDQIHPNLVCSAFSRSERFSTRSRIRNFGWLDYHWATLTVNDSTPTQQAMDHRPI